MSTHHAQRWRAVLLEAANKARREGALQCDEKLLHDVSFFVRATWTASPRDREYSAGGKRCVPTLNARSLKIAARAPDFSSNIAAALFAAGARVLDEAAAQFDDAATPSTDAATPSNRANFAAHHIRLIARVLRMYASRADAPRGAIEEAKGFLNFHLNDETLTAATARALQENERYGADASLAGKRIAVEFVSADPTGDLSFAHAHDGALGEALCRLLEMQGAEITREYFVNDDPSSSPVKLLGASATAHYASHFGDVSTRGDDILQTAFVRHAAQEIAEKDGDAHLLLEDDARAAAFAQRLSQRAVALQKETLKRYGITFDEWTSEQALIREGRVAFIVQRLAKNGHIEERDGTTWLKSAALGDESDRVLQRPGGHYTYFATDIAYHAYKIERGFDTLINIWPTTHRPYIERTRIALRAAGYDESRIEMIVCDGARLLRDGALLSTQGDDAMTLNEALHETDAATLRFFMALRGWDEVADFDIEAARRDDEHNAAYVAKLLPERLAMLERETRAKSDADGSPEYSAAFADDAVRDLARLVAQWPDAAHQAAHDRAPHRIARFVLEMAAATRTLAAATLPETAHTAARAEVLQAAHITARAALRVLGIA